MVKKGLLVLIIAVLAAGGVFAQSNFASMAKNTVTVDVGPTIVGFAVSPLASKLGDMIPGADNIADINISGFNIAVQYERHLFSQISVAGRFVYGAPKGDFSYKVGSASGTPELNLTSLAAEGHARFYPLGDTFFLDGMVGYARLSADASGTFIAGSGSRRGSASESSNYLKYGVKLGWRINLGKIGGLTFEPAIGYYMGTALGDTLSKKLTTSLAESLSVNVSELSSFKDAFSAMENFVLIGGPRVSLALGYRF
jgi:hypothetical protein